MVKTQLQSALNLGIIYLEIQEKENKNNE